MALKLSQTDIYLQQVAYTPYVVWISHQTQRMTGRGYTPKNPRDLNFHLQFNDVCPDRLDWRWIAREGAGNHERIWIMSHLGCLASCSLKQLKPADSIHTCKGRVFMLANTRFRKKAGIST